ncbi:MULTISPECIES: MerR family transcriptional regulator [Bacillales]|uniref:MerR family transcriptional regulator n=1 Tax=Bacillales TaxID=1385 RepID=UPI0006A79458|nr:MULTISPECIES: MerR family transcriptional regulator [Bacillales]OBZ13634.1 MerR family transcriptional regulator [Bacillus sp. FJAT-26390]
MNEANGYSIKEAAVRAGLTGDTIRYYEKIGLLPRAERKQNQHRVYRLEDVDTMKLITCLKKTGMPLEDMKPFLNLSSDADITEFPELHDMMLNHKNKIISQIDSLQQVVDFIDTKLSKQMAEEQACSLSGENVRMPLGSAK